jgi:plasmid stabilization system protein ParE
VKLRYAPRATRDLAEIAEYLHARNPSAALAVRDAILRSLRNLVLFPAVGAGNGERSGTTCRSSSIDPFGHINLNRRESSLPVLLERIPV